MTTASRYRAAANGDILCRACGGIGTACICEPMKDHFGRPINVGDTVQVDCIDTSRGAQMWMHRGTVVGFALTRIKVEFGSASGIYHVGPECVAVIR